MQSFFYYFFFFFSYFLFPFPFLFVLPLYTNQVINKKLKSFPKSWVESQKCSKNPKNWSKFQFFHQKCQKTDQNSTKMIKKLTEYKNICPKWSKKPKSQSDFQFSGQKKSKNWNLAWCFASILQIFLFQKKARFIHLALDLWHYVINPFFHTSSDEEQGEGYNFKIKFNFFHIFLF